MNMALLGTEIDFTFFYFTVFYFRQLQVDKISCLTAQIFLKIGWNFARKNLQVPPPARKWKQEQHNHDYIHLRLVSK